MELLKDRLYNRLASLGINVLEVESVEEGALDLPLNQPVPDLEGRVLGFGAAVGFVHPATGWSVSYSLKMADRVADSIADGFGRSLPPAAVARETYRVIWTPELLKMRKIHLLGGKFFTRIGIRTLSVFMRLFFSAPGEMWRVYLSNDCTVPAINDSLLGRTNR